MPRVFDNIQAGLLPALVETMQGSYRGDFCVGYFNLYGWREVDGQVAGWTGGEDNCCRLLVGMQKLPDEELREARSFFGSPDTLDTPTLIRLRSKIVEDFRRQLAMGRPSNFDEQGLRELRQRLREKKLIVKLYLRSQLHAKLYLLFRNDHVTPIVGYLGSSNLTLAGLKRQGELNVDVTDQDACQKLSDWFTERWEDEQSLDISDRLAEILDESWAREELVPPYHIYVKMAYHLSEDARAGLTEFPIPADFNDELLGFQVAAVKIAARHLEQRNGVLIGDVVGLGKTMMAAALARIVEDEKGIETLILCPKNLVPMWKHYKVKYRMRAEVMSMGKVLTQLHKMPTHRLVIIDESHNLRNRESKRHKAVREFIDKNRSQCILLSATPYNKTYEDLSGQLRLFLDETAELKIRPERYLRAEGLDFFSKHQIAPNTLAAFEKSKDANDWRDLMRLYLVRRTRSFIQEHYAEKDPENGRLYVTFASGARSYFPERVPKTVPFAVDGQYAKLFSAPVVQQINSLKLPRYGLGEHLKDAVLPDSAGDKEILDDLSRAGTRLRGFCRTNLLKRLESSGPAFLLSVKRHILRNYIFLYALREKLPLPIGSLDSGLLDENYVDGDADSETWFGMEETEAEKGALTLQSEEDFYKQAGSAYRTHWKKHGGKNKKSFRWVDSQYFKEELSTKLLEDAATLLKILKEAGAWNAAADSKLAELHKLLTQNYPGQKVIVFTQFADTIAYLEKHLKARGMQDLAPVTGASQNPTELAQRFSPVSNQVQDAGEELRVLLATDVLSEGQNLQDCSIVVNYDLPWAIVRLIQRVGRVDRIGQQSDKIYCHSFLPAKGIEDRIELRKRMRERLGENAEVVGTDEAFFEDEGKQKILDLYNEKAGILDDADDADVDLASYAYQIWQEAITADPGLKKRIEAMPPVVHASKALPAQAANAAGPEGVLVHVRTAQDTDALARVNREGKLLSTSPLEILRAAACEPDEPGCVRHEKHYDLVGVATEKVAHDAPLQGGQLGPRRSVRFQVYERLKRYQLRVKDQLFETEALKRSVEEIYRFPLHQTAVEALGRHLRAGISSEALAERVIELRDKGRLNKDLKEIEREEPQIICSLGLLREGES